jgi:hypothetical protein
VATSDEINKTQKQSIKALAPLPLACEATTPQPNLCALQDVKAVSECVDSVELRINGSVHSTVQRGEVGVRKGT